MPPVALNNILEATFRANPSYRLVLFDRLPPEEQKFLPGLELDPDFYGLLCSRERTDLGVKSVCRDTALLYLTMGTPGKLPAYVRGLFGDQSNHAIAELVLDGVLEINANGTFVSGPRAHRLIYSESSPAEPRGFLASRSIAALKYAEALGLRDSQKLSARLYCYGRQPLSPHWTRRFPTRGAVSEFLGIDAKSATRSSLDQNWLSIPSSEPDDAWLSWKSRSPRQAQSASELAYKLYVSPDVEFTRDAFQTTVKVMSEVRAPSFKVGGDVYGLLRPDKLVVYFWNFDELQRASSYLSDRLNGCPAQGVPFTAEIAGEGLLSWGMDPPRDRSTPDWNRSQSWRSWVTNRLAVSLLSATVAPLDGVKPWKFALDRLQLEGVDTGTWAPTQAIWHEGLVGR